MERENGKDFVRVSKALDFNKLVEFVIGLFSNHRVIYLTSRCKSIEIALKALNIIREQVGGIESVIKFSLQSFRRKDKPYHEILIKESKNILEV